MAAQASSHTKALKNPIADEFHPVWDFCILNPTLSSCQDWNNHFPSSWSNRTCSPSLHDERECVSLGCWWTAGMSIQNSFEPFSDSWPHCPESTWLQVYPWTQYSSLQFHRPCSTMGCAWKGCCQPESFSRSLNDMQERSCKSRCDSLSKGGL